MLLTDRLKFDRKGRIIPGGEEPQIDMSTSRKAVYFQKLRWILGLKLALLYTLIPSQPSVVERGHWVEMAPDASGKREKILKIYSILRTYRSELDETSTWAIAETIMGESERYSLDPILVLAIIKVESNFHPEALSTEGARGLMQIRPFVAATLVEKVDLGQWEGEKSLDDPILNIKLGVFYINYLNKRFRDLEVALTAYNHGPTDIESRLEYEEPIPLGYAKRVLSAYRIYHEDHRTRHNRRWKRAIDPR